jgi:hypothetical protein
LLNCCVVAGTVVGLVVAFVVANGLLIRAVNAIERKVVMIMIFNKFKIKVGL